MMILNETGRRSRSDMLHLWVGKRGQVVSVLLRISFVLNKDDLLLTFVKPTSPPPTLIFAPLRYSIPHPNLQVKFIYTLPSSYILCYEFSIQIHYARALEKGWVPD